jgi:hypothetical protein
MSQPPAKLSASMGIDSNEKAVPVTEARQTEKTAPSAVEETPK